MVFWSAMKLQSKFIQTCWSNLILSFPKVWWKRHNCFEISIQKILKSWRDVWKRHICLSLMTIIFKKRFYRIELNNSSNRIYIYYDHWINQLNFHTTSLGSLSMDMLWMWRRNQFQFINVNKRYKCWNKTKLALSYVD